MFSRIILCIIQLSVKRLKDELPSESRFTISDFGRPWPMTRYLSGVYVDPYMRQATENPLTQIIVGHLQLNGSSRRLIQRI